MLRLITEIIDSDIRAILLSLIFHPNSLITINIIPNRKNAISVREVMIKKFYLTQG